MIAHRELSDEKSFWDQFCFLIWEFLHLASVIVSIKRNRF